MQLNFLGLILVGVGIVAVGLGISGNYGAFGRSVAKSVKKSKPASGGGGSSGGF